MVINLFMTALFNQPWNFATLLGGGELLLLSFALLLGAAGDIIGSRPGFDKAKRAGVGICVAVSFAIGVVYVPAIYPDRFAEPPSASLIGVLSLVFYIVALVTSLTALYAAKGSGNVQHNSGNSSSS